MSTARAAKKLVPAGRSRRAAPARLAERAQRHDANAAFPITEDVLAAYLSGFEVPHGAGEHIVTVTFLTFRMPIVLRHGRQRGRHGDHHKRIGSGTLLP